MRVVVSQFEGIVNTPALPLAAGVLVASAKLDPDLARNASFSIVVNRGPIEATVTGLNAPDVLGLSLYPWNVTYSLAVAAAARHAYPETFIVAGGPAVPRPHNLARRILDANPALDALAFSEGELTFRSLLRARLRSEDLRRVGGLALRRGEQICFTAPPERVHDFTQTASPYLDGTFDALLEDDGARASFGMALIETNRGCPFSCTFCDWSLTKKVVEVPMDRVRAELDWIASHGFGHMAIADANFGIRPRDADIARALAEIKRAAGLPTYCYFYLTKNNHRRNLETIEIFNEAGIGCCVGLAVQDFDDDVLKAVKRDNIQTAESFKLREIMGDRGIPTHNELILGLPRQTYDSFAKTLVAAMPSWPRHEFVVFLCHLLDNTEMAEPAQRERFGVQTRRCLWRAQRAGWDPVVEEYQELVVGTIDMPLEDWRHTFQLASFAGAVYNLRLLRVVLKWLTDVVQVDLQAYLEHLCKLTQETPGGSVFSDIGQVLTSYVDSILAGGPFVLPVANSETFVEADEGVAYAALVRPDEFFEEVDQATQSFLAGDFSGRTATELREVIRFQQLITPVFSQPGIQCEAFSHDWVTFMGSRATDAALTQRPISASFTPPVYVQMGDLPSFVTTHFACTRAHVNTGDVTLAETTPPGRLPLP